MRDSTKKKYTKYLRLMHTLSKEGGSTSNDVYKKERVYRQKGITTHALNILHQFKYVRRDELKKNNYVYRLTPLGKSILTLAEPTQFKKLALRELIAEKGDKCCVCSSTFSLVFFAKQLYCPQCLNRDTKIFPAYQNCSMLGLAQEL